MPRSLLRCLLLLAPLWLAALSAGCGSPWKQELVYKGGNEGVFLYVEHREDEENITTALANSHPYEVDSLQLAYLLDRLTYEHKPVFTSVRAAHVFTPEQVQSLAGPMSESLAKLSPDQRLRFLAISPSIGKIFVGLTGTSGVAFRKGELFQLAFDTIDEGVNDGDGGRPENVVFSDDPTDMEFSHGLNIPFSGAKIHIDQDSGRVFKRWIDVPEASWLSAMKATKEGAEIAKSNAAETPAIPPPAAASPVEPQPDKLSLEPSELTEAQKADLVETKERLKKLEYLKKEGAITEEQYREQVKAILEGL